MSQVLSVGGLEDKSLARKLFLKTIFAFGESSYLTKSTIVQFPILLYRVINGLRLISFDSLSHRFFFFQFSIFIGAFITHITIYFVP